MIAAVLLIALSVLAAVALAAGAFLVGVAAGAVRAESPTSTGRRGLSAELERTS